MDRLRASALLFTLMIIVAAGCGGADEGGAEKSRRAPEKVTRPRTSEKAGRFTESVIRGMTRLAHQHGAVNLSQGFPDFPAPEAVKAAAVEAIRAEALHDDAPERPGGGRGNGAGVEEKTAAVGLGAAASGARACSSSSTPMATACSRSSTRRRPAPHQLPITNSLTTCINPTWTR